MKTFEFKIQEVLSRTIEVEAETEDKAYLKIKDMYREEEIVLDNSDFVETEIKLKNNFQQQNVKDNLIAEIIEYLYNDEKKHYEEYDNEKPSEHIFLKLEKLKMLI